MDARVEVVSEHSYEDRTRSRKASAATIDCRSIKKEQEDDTSTEVCPFVCGICSEKFEKISPFYAHLKTHSSFENLQIGKKNDMLKALDVHNKVDENIFRCGICQIDFPTMSLLHEHMVLEENMTNYQYSNDDHTARPNQRAVSVKLSKIVSPSKSTESSKRKASLALESGQKSKKKRCDVDNDTCSNETIFIELGKSKKSFVGKSNTIASAEEPVVGRSNSSPSTRSSSRLSRSRSTKRVDYKALAGIVTPKVENDNTERVKEDKKYSSLNSTDVDEDEEEDQTDDQSKVSELKKRSGRRDTTTDVQNTTDIENTIEQSEPIKEIEDESAEDITTENEANLKEEMIKADPGIVKEDGTCDTASMTSTLSMQVVSVTTDSVDDETLSDNDSDDDFGDIIQDFPNDDFKDESNDEFQDDPNDEDYILMNDLKDRKEYLKKHALKTKQRCRKTGGRIVNNCLYPCRVCGKYFIWKALKKHSYAHIKVKKVECPKCGKKYKSKRHLGDHIRSVHTMAKYRCGICGDMLKGKQGFEKHATLHVLRNEISGCMDDIAMHEVTEKEYLEWRQSSSKREALRKRKPPALVAADTQTESEATEAAEVEKPVAIPGASVQLDKGLIGASTNLDCKVCSKHFLTHESMMVHLLEHKGDTQFQCEGCKAFFISNEHLENHIAEVHGQSIHVCDICGERFKSVYAMWSHKGKHLMKTDKYYSEDIIKKLQEEIKAKKTKKRFIKKPTVRKTQICEVCGAVILSSRVKRHMEIHKDTKEWECDICHKFYKTRRYLIDHKKKTHFAETASCDICGQTFRGKAYLEIHKQIHGPRDKMCPYCDKGFTTMMYLKAHLITHQEKKQYKCDQCLAAFSHKQRLHIHKLENHHTGEGRPCKYCGELFPSREKARKHERRIHEGIRYTKRGSRYRQPGDIGGGLQINVLDEQGEASSDTQNKRIVQFIAPEFLSSGVSSVKVPTGNKPSTNVGKNLPQIVHNDIAEGAQFIKFENGDEYELMLEGGDGEEPVEVIELSEEQHNVFIQETTEEAIAAQSLQGKDDGNNVEQVLEIPENAEQCQILLFPDGTFKLLNVVDNSDNSASS